MVVVVMVFQLDFHDRLDLVRVTGAERQHAKIVAKKLDRMMVAMEGREIGEKGAFLGVFHMAFQGQVAFGLGQLENGKENAEELFISVLVVFRALDHLAQRLDGANHDQFRVGNQKSPESAAENDDVFDRLPQDPQVTVNGIAAENGANDNQQADNKKHPGPQSFYMPVR